VGSGILSLDRIMYTVTILASLQSQCLVELIAQPVEICSLTRDDGFATILIKCDAATAATIAERYHVSEV
jgi:hypothetical protein